MDAHHTLTKRASRPGTSWGTQTHQKGTAAEGRDTGHSWPRWAQPSALQSCQAILPDLKMTIRLPLRLQVTGFSNKIKETTFVPGIPSTKSLRNRRTSQFQNISFIITGVVKEKNLRNPLVLIPNISKIP